MGHLLDFFVGDAQNLRDRVGRSLPNFDPEHPHTGFVRGMHAFGLEESGHYERAARVGLAAVERNPDDVWGIHAVVHALEMQGKVDDGIRFLRSRETGLGERQPVHGAQLVAPRAVPPRSRPPRRGARDLRRAGPQRRVRRRAARDARRQRAPVATHARRGRYAKDGSVRSRTRGRAGSGASSWYVFNDLHAVIALCGAGRLDEARDVVDDLTRYVASTPAHTQSNAMMAAEVGLPASRAVIAFTEGRHDDVVDELWPIRARFQRFGGSHAQRDLLQRTLTDSAIRSGQLELARALLNERLSQRDTSIYGLRRQASVLRRRARPMRPRRRSSAPGSTRRHSPRRRAARTRKGCND